MELDELLKLIDHVSSSKLDDFCYETGDMKLRLKKNTAKEVVVKQLSDSSLLQGVSAAASTNFANAKETAETAKATEASEVESLSSAQHSIDSPLVGIFYTAPGEGEEPFVRVGDRVKKGQTLGIVEAMKLMHEITCEETGVIKEICAENGAAVEYGQKLFVIAQD